MTVTEPTLTNALDALRVGDARRAEVHLTSVLDTLPSTPGDPLAPVRVRVTDALTVLHDHADVEAHTLRALTPEEHAQAVADVE